MTDRLNRVGQIFIDPDGVSAVLVDDGLVLTAPFGREESMDWSPIEHLEMFQLWLGCRDDMDIDSESRSSETIRAFSEDVAKAASAYRANEEHVPDRRIEEYWDVVLESDDLDNTVSEWRREAECDRMIQEFESTGLVLELTALNDGREPNCRILYDQESSLQVKMANAFIFIHRRPDDTYDYEVKEGSRLSDRTRVVDSSQGVPLESLKLRLGGILSGLIRDPQKQDENRGSIKI